MSARLKDYDNFIKDAMFYDYVIENLEIENTVNQIMKLIEKYNK